MNDAFAGVGLSKLIAIVEQMGSAVKGHTYLSGIFLIS